MLKVISVVFFILCLSGCATCSKNTDVQIKNLQAELGQAKSELQQKDEQIKILEKELNYSKTNPVSTGEVGNIKLSVKQIQEGLKNAGYYDGPIDGKIGKDTRRAIRGFQEANGLKVDGIVGSQTALKLKEFLK
ncbi:MAG: peptidoglycan-binding domain-containing protein [Candidatus Omnitrophota bacterium]